MCIRDRTNPPQQHCLRPLRCQLRCCDRPCLCPWPCEHLCLAVPAELAWALPCPCQNPAALP
eukprot:6921551-Alexandrium_andersonii.AAC.1